MLFALLSVQVETLDVRLIFSCPNSKWFLLNGDIADSYDPGGKFKLAYAPSIAAPVLLTP